jgi:hypothetical protein
MVDAQYFLDVSQFIDMLLLSADLLADYLLAAIFCRIIQKYFNHNQQ